MPAPVASNRGVPDGFMLRNGYQTLITFAVDPTLELWEKVVTPFSMKGGEKIDVTTQHNRQLKTYSAPILVELGDAKFTCAFDTEFFDGADFLAIINVETTITQTFPDGSQVAFFGYLAEFEPEGMEHGKQPEATVVIKVTNRDPSQPLRAVPPGEFGAGTGTAYLVNEFKPVWTGAGHD